MNYLKELNAFYNQMTFNPISGSAVALWNTLMHFNNLCGWRKQFSVPAGMLQLKSGTKESAFKRARNELLEKGYIRMQSRSGNQAAVYEMISQVQHFGQSHGFVEAADDQMSDRNVTDSVDHSETGAETGAGCAAYRQDNSANHSMNRNMDHTTDYSADPLIKHKEIQKETKRKVMIMTDAIRFYQDNFGVISSFVSDDMLNWINDMGESLVIAAMERAEE